MTGPADDDAQELARVVVLSDLAELNANLVDLGGHVLVTDGAARALDDEQLRRVLTATAEALVHLATVTEEGAGR